MTDERMGYLFWLSSLNLHESKSSREAIGYLHETVWNLMLLTYHHGEWVPDREDDGDVLCSIAEQLNELVTGVKLPVTVLQPTLDEALQTFHAAAVDVVHSLLAQVGDSKQRQRVKDALREVDEMLREVL